MKIRQGFVSNSSSSSFILELDHEVTDEKSFELKMKSYFKKHPEDSEIYYNASEWDSDLEGIYKTEDVRKFMYKLLASGTMKPLNKWLLDYLWEELRERGECPWNMFGLTIQRALKIMEEDPMRYGSMTIDTLKQVAKETTAEEQCNLIYVVELGNDAEFNYDNNMNFDGDDYNMSVLIRDNPAELGAYEFYRLWY